MQTPEIDGAAIVMIGSFNPAIFQPRWLGTQELIRPEEAESAKISTIQAELADFATEWFQLQVLRDRFQLQSSDPRQYGPLRDLVAAIVAILPHTPIKVLALSRQLHFKMSSGEAWHAIGHLLAPKEPWNQILASPGLRSVLMQGRRKNADGGIVHIKVEPSLKVQHGLYIEVNEEFRPSPETDEDAGALWVPRCLATQWDDILQFSETASEHLLSLVNQ